MNIDAAIFNARNDRFLTENCFCFVPLVMFHFFSLVFFFISLLLLFYDTAFSIEDLLAVENVVEKNTMVECALQ